MRDTDSADCSMIQREFGLGVTTKAAMCEINKLDLQLA